jgi:hypothetical protein
MVMFWTIFTFTPSNGTSVFVPNYPYILNLSATLHILIDVIC